jgi:phosphoglycerate dehydrogenase-like enzyme
VSRAGVILGCMELSPPPLVVAFDLSERRKSIVADALAGASAIIYLAELDGAARAEALRNAGALLTHNTAKDLRSGEAALLRSARLIQFTIAGVDFIPLSELPEGVPVATNGGGYAEPMAEHALAMTLAAAKRLIVEHENLKRGELIGGEVAEELHAAAAFDECEALDHEAGRVLRVSQYCEGT